MVISICLILPVRRELLTKAGAISPAVSLCLPCMQKSRSRWALLGVIEVDASPWVEGNLWVLETIQTDPMMVGTVGNLRPEKPEFGEYISTAMRKIPSIGAFATESACPTPERET